MRTTVKNAGILLLIIFLFYGNSYAQITKLPECNTGVPHFNIDLSSDPDSMYITPEVERAKQCCGNVSSNENYVSFYVKAHPDVAMIEVDIYSGANPPGDAAKYNVVTGGDSLTAGSCGPLIDAGAPTCVTLDSSGYLKVTYYKPGKNKNRYYFKQIPKPIFPADDSTRVGCSLPLEIFGLNNITITSINSSTGNTTLGAYNSLLSCTNCPTPSFSPGLSTPAWVDYQISGTPQAQTCGTYVSTDTVRLYTFSELGISATPNPASFCSGGSGVTIIATATGGDGNYFYKWKNSVGTIVSTTNTYLAVTAGTYTAEVTDGLASATCPAKYVSVPVSIGNPPVVDASIDQTLCATSPIAFLSGQVQYASGGVWSGGNGVFNPSENSLITTYTPTATEIGNGSVTLTLTSTGAGGGCVNDNDQVVINFSDTIFVNPTAAPILCKGGTTTVFANATGGTSPYQYTWSTGASSPSILASSGTYSVMVRDVFGCASGASITLSNPTQLVLIMSSTNVSADALCDGNASVNISGGTPPYNVLWSNLETTLTTSNTLCYGIATVTVTDANGCSVMGSVVVNNPTCSAFNVTANSTDVSCYGGNNGTAASFPVGGITPYTYQWNSSPVQTTQNASNLSAGNYTVTVTDSVGCIDVAGVTVQQPTILTNTIIHTDVTTIGGSNGSATANPLGGTPNYQYLWTPSGQITQTASNLSSAVGGLVHYLTITDDNSCMLNDSVLINQPPCYNFILAVNTTNVTCNGLSDGAASLVIAHGTPPYDIVWSNGATNVTSVSGLAEGTYTVSVTDASNCTTFKIFTISQPNLLTLGLIPTNISCFGYKDGTIDLTVSGGTFPYSYLWTTGGNPIANYEDLVGLQPGTYSITVLDENKCAASGSIGITQPLALSACYTYVDNLCNGYSAGSIDITPSGGVFPYNYSWNGPSGYTNNTQDVSGLASGLYEIEFSDGSGCQSSALQVYINQPDTVFIENITVSCPASGVSTTTVTVDLVTGGTGGPYQISYDNQVTFQPLGVYTKTLTVGATYQVWAKDANGCLSPFAYVLTIDSNVNIVSATFNPCIPQGATTIPVTVNPTGGDGGLYQVSTDGGLTWAAAGTYVINLPVNANYNISVKDGKGCITTNYPISIPAELTSTIVMTNEVSCLGANDGALNLTVSGGTPTYQYAWTGPSTFTSSNEDLSNLYAGTYYVTITDNEGCTKLDSIVITTVVDITNPVITCVSNQIVPSSTTSCEYTVTDIAWDATATDNCVVSDVSYTLTGATSGAGNSLNGVSFNSGITTVTWVATDGLGNTDQCVYTVTVVDTTSPGIIACGAGNQTVNVDAGECNYTQTTTAWDATATDNCTISSITATLTGVTTGTGLTTLNGINFNTGITHVLWTVTDTVGNSTTCSYDITVIDNIDPSIITCGAGNQTVNVDAGECNYTQTTTAWDATATDNCTVSSITATLTGVTTGTGLTTLNGINFNTGITHVLWTVTDTVGNTTTCSYDITVIDNIDPNIIACGAGNQTVNVDAGECNYTQTTTAWDATATDNCTVSSITATLTGVTTGTGLTTLNGINFNTGITHVLWTVTDTVGNTTTCSYDITVIDNIDPSIIACGAGNQTVNVDSGECNYTQTTSVWDATATDNCTISSITATLTGVTTGTGLTTLNGINFNTGITHVIWTVTDTVGNTTTCSYDITVIDNIDPSIIACGAGNQTVNVDAGECNYTQTTTAWDATATDNCTVSSITATLTGVTTGTGLTTLNGINFNTGITHVLWTVTDTVGNTTTCSYDITVIDNIDPSIISCGAGNQTINVDAGECNYTQTTTAWDATATDNCTVSSITATLTGATTGSGLTTLAGVNFNTGITHVIWTVTDTVGNTTTCSYDITVIDNIDPSIITCGAGNQVVSSDTGICTYINVGLDWDATATDNCTVASITYSLSGVTTGTGLSLNGVVFNPGLTTVVWTVIDTSGNSSTCTFTVEVIDTELPIISNCPADIMISNDNGYCGAIVNWTPPTFTDNCSATMVSTHNTGDYFNVGTTTVTYTVTDLSGNVSNCSFDITVDDTEAPIVVCPSPIASCDSLIYFNNPIVSDNCGILSMTQIAGLSSGSIFPVGVTTITFEAIDIHNNVTQCSFDVTVHPTPILTLQATNVSCNDFNDGSIDLMVTNGTSPYTYLWSNSAITEDIFNLSPDNYSVVVTDASGCSAIAQTNIIQPDVLTINAINTQVSCFNGNNGAIDVTVGGGVYPYTYLWNSTEITEDISNLTIGFYQVTATDANGCVISYSTTLTQPDSLMIQTVVYDATCNAENGSIQAQVTGGTTPYVYSWSNGTSGLNLNNVVAGTYTLMVTDAKLCTNQFTGTINSLSNLVAELNTIDVSCFGGNNGAADVFIRSGNAPYTYQWSNGDTTAVSSHLTVGSYTVTVTDVFSCQVNLALTINQPDSLYATLTLSEYPSGTNVSLYGSSDGYITSAVFGGVSPFAYLWSNGETTENVYDLKAGDYSLIVTDENGCLAYASAKLIQPYILEMPSGYSPNLDGSNDYFVVKGIEAYPKNEITVFNRWGNIVYEKTNYSNEWDGNNTSGEPLPNATYFVIFKAFSDENITLTGYVDLRR